MQTFSKIIFYIVLDLLTDIIENRLDTSTLISEVRYTFFYIFLKYTQNINKNEKSLYG